jgi:hypothetical protein
MESLIKFGSFRVVIFEFPCALISCRFISVVSRRFSLSIACGCVHSSSGLAAGGRELVVFTLVLGLFA